MTGKQKTKVLKLLYGHVFCFEQFKQQRQKILFNLFASVGIPVLCAFSTYHLISQNYSDGVFIAGVALFLIGSYLSFKFVKRAEYIYRACVSLLGVFFLYYVYVGGDQGSKLLWMYLFPLIAFFMTGRAYGLLFSTSALFIVGFLFFSQKMAWFDSHIYENEIQLRFIITYSMVSAFTFIFEHMRYQYQKAMEKEHTLLLDKQKELTKANAEIRILSLNDHLTGCYNRLYLNKYFSMEVQRSQRYSKPLSIIMCDIDHFKKVNDTYGHQTGDSVLKTVALIIRSHVREDIDWVARYGGEEFIIVLPETQFTKALIVADRLLQVVASNPIKIDEQSITVTASFGVTGTGVGCSTKVVDQDAFINIADRLLYCAKNQGRNQVASEPISV